MSQKKVISALDHHLGRQKHYYRQRKKNLLSPSAGVKMIVKKNWRQFDDLKMIENAPLSAP
jgi:hypothetical protein